MHKGISVSTMSVSLAHILGEKFRMELYEFLKKSYVHECLSWTHCATLYIELPQGYIFHRIITVCNRCESKADRNMAGIGTMYLLNTGEKKMEILCRECAKSYTQYMPFMKEKAMQLELF